MHLPLQQVDPPLQAPVFQFRTYSRVAAMSKS